MKQMALSFMKPRPKISMLNSAYFAEEWLDGHYRSIVNQTIWDDGQIEVVVVCQAGSEEESIARAYGDNFTVITTASMPSVSRAWNLAIMHARGDYYVTSNSDDRYAENYAEIMSTALDNNPNLDLVYADQFISYESMSIDDFMKQTNLKPLIVNKIDFDKREPGMFSRGPYSRGRLVRKCFCGPQPMWRASVHAGFFDENLLYAMDYDMWMRISKPDNMMWIPQPLGLYHARPDSLEHGNKSQSEQERFRIIEKYRMERADIFFINDGSWGKKFALIIGDSYTVLDMDDTIKEFMKVSDEMKGNGHGESREESDQGIKCQL